MTEMYNWKFWQEFVWALAIGAVVFVATSLMTVDDLSQWSAWAPAIGGGLTRFIAGFVASRLGQFAPQRDDE